jgi:hypothetical protein
MTRDEFNRLCEGLSHEAVNLAYALVKKGWKVKRAVPYVVAMEMEMRAAHE